MSEEIRECPQCASKEWECMGDFERYNPHRKETEYRCTLCGHRERVTVFVARKGGPGIKAECRTGKRIYPNKKDAQTAVNFRMRSFRNQPSMLRTYPCHDCHGWHLTHRPLAAFA